MRRLTVFLPTAVADRPVANVRDNGRIAVGFSGMLDHKSVQVKGRVVEVRIFRRKGAGAIPAQLDGEEFPSHDHYRVENLPHHLRIIVPENPHWI